MTMVNLQVIEGGGPGLKGFRGTHTCTYTHMYIQNSTYSTCKYTITTEGI